MSTVVPRGATAALVAVALITASVARAQSPVSQGNASAAEHVATAADSAGIRQAALDYIEGWYEGNGERMERALHPELAKRIVRTDPKTGRSNIGMMGALTLVNSTKAGYGAQTPAARKRKDVRILDIYENASSARVDAGDWVDFLHLAKWNGRWVIVNVLWEMRPAPQAP
jgi:Putative lumazine-binding